MNHLSQSKQITKNKLTFSLNENDKTASIIKSSSASGDIIIPQFINHESQEFIITSIENGSFKYSNRIKSIKFTPDSKLRTICKNAFAGSTIKSISIPSCVYELNEGWCDGIRKYTEITVMKCKEQNILLYDDKFIIGKSDIKSDTYDIFYFSQRNINEVIIPSFIKIISSYAFSNSLLESVTIPSNVTQICECAFSCCYNLKTLKTQENSKLVIIGKLSFAGSTIENLTIPSSIREFNEGWCEGMQYLTEIEIIENKEKNICYYDNKFIIGKSDLKNDVFDVIIFARRDIINPKIPSFIKRIESHSFAYSSFASITVPPQITHICHPSFSSCSKLQYVEINADSNIQIIENHAFSYSSLRCFFIPSKVTKIEDEVFFHSDCLQIIEIGDNINVQLIDKLLINSAENAIIMIPVHQN